MKLLRELTFSHLFAFFFSLMLELWFFIVFTTFNLLFWSIYDIVVIGVNFTWKLDMMLQPNLVEKIIVIKVSGKRHWAICLQFNIFAITRNGRRHALDRWLLIWWTVMVYYLFHTRLLFHSSPCSSFRKRWQSVKRLLMSLSAFFRNDSKFDSSLIRYSRSCWMRFKSIAFFNFCQYVLLPIIAADHCHTGYGRTLTCKQRLIRCFLGFIYLTHVPSFLCLSLRRLRRDALR